MRAVVLGVVALMSLTGESRAADTPAAPKLIPAATFADQPFISQPLLSPDGLRIAARSTVEGKSKLAIFLIADLNATPRIFDVGDKKIADVNWAGPNRVLMTISTTLKFEGDDYPVTRLLEIDLATGKAQYLDTRSNGFFAGDVLYTEPAGEWVLVSSQDDVFSTPSVKRIDLATGAVKVVEKQRPDVWTWYADNHGVWYAPASPMTRIAGRSGIAKSPRTRSSRSAARLRRMTTRARSTACISLPATIAA